MRSLIGALSISLCLAFVTVACGSGEGQTAAGSDGAEPAPTSTSSPLPHVTTESGETVPPTAPPDPSAIEARRFEVGGAVVWTGSALDELPRQATVVRFTDTLIDSGDGLELCGGNVATSLPPQCGGPVVDGLDPEGWTETLEGVTWGTRTVTVAWPPVDGHLTLVADEDTVAPAPLGDPRREGLPEECEAIGTFVDRETMSAFAEANQERVDGPRAVDGGEVLVLGVVEEHMEAVRAELSAGGAEPCLEPVTYSAAELEAAQAALMEAGLYQPGGPLTGSGSGNALNRIDATVMVADRASVEALLSHVDDPGMFHIVGLGEILEGA